MLKHLLILSSAIYGVVSQSFSQVIYPQALIDNINNGGFISNQIHSPRLKFLDDSPNFLHFNLTNLAVVLAPKGMCGSTPVNMPTIPGWNGSIALMYLPSGDIGVGCQNAEIFAAACIKLGAKAGIFKGFYNPVGPVAFERYGMANKDLQIPTVILQADTFQIIFDYLTKTSGSYMVMNLIDTPNAWDSFFSGIPWGFLSFMGDLLSVVTIVIGVYKLRIFITEIDKGIKLTISQVVLVLEIIGNTLRFFFFIDPFGKRGIFLFPISRWLCGASLPYNLGSLILLVLYFKKLVSGLSGANSPFFESKPVRYIFGGSVVWLVLFDVIAVIDNEVLNEYLITLLELIQLMIFTLVLGVSYFFLGRSVVGSLSKGASSRSKSTDGTVSAAERKITVMSRYIFANSAMNILSLVSMGAYTFVSSLGQGVFFWSIFGVMISTCTSSLLVVSSFQVASTKQKTNVKDGTTTKKISVAAGSKGETAISNLNTSNALASSIASKNMKSEASTMSTKSEVSGPGDV